MPDIHVFVLFFNQEGHMFYFHNDAFLFFFPFKFKYNKILIYRSIY